MAKKKNKNKSNQVAIDNSHTAKAEAKNQSANKNSIINKNNGNTFRSHTKTWLALFIIIILLLLFFIFFATRNNSSENATENTDGSNISIDLNNTNNDSIAGENNSNEKNDNIENVEEQVDSTTGEDSSADNSVQEADESDANKITDNTDNVNQEEQNNITNDLEGRVDASGSASTTNKKIATGHSKSGSEKSFGMQALIQKTGVWEATDYKFGDIFAEKYEIQFGDTLWEIAEAKYGDGFRWDEIYNANQSKVGTLPNGCLGLIFPGDVLLLK